MTRRACLCSWPGCRKLTEECHAAGSLNGGYMSLPTKDDSRRLRFAKHLGCGSDVRSGFVSRVHIALEHQTAGACVGGVGVAETCGAGDSSDRVKRGAGPYWVVPSVTQRDVQIEPNKVPRRPSAPRSAAPPSGRASRAAAVSAAAAGMGAAPPTIASLERDLRQARQQATQLRDQLEAEVARRKAREEEVRALQESNALLHARIERECIGISRFTMASDAWHAKHPTAALLLYGYDDWSETKEYLRCYWPGITAEHERIMRKAGNHHLTDFEKALLTLLTMRKARTEAELALYVDRSRPRLHQILDEWIPKFGEIGDMLCNLDDMPIEYVAQALPHAFIRAGGQRAKTFTIGDGKDILTDATRVDNVTNRLQQSSKMKAAAARGMSWMLACGLYHIVSHLFFSRVDEMKLMRAHAHRFAVVPPGWCLLYDRAGAKAQTMLPNLNYVSSPAFVDGRATFHPSEVAEDRITATLRYGVEVGYSRITNNAYCRDRVPRGHFRHLNNVWLYGHGKANLMKALRPPKHVTPYLAGLMKES